MKKIKESWLIKGVIGFFAVSVVFVFITAAQATYITNYIKPVQVGLPVANTDAATKAYVDTVVAASPGGKILCNSVNCVIGMASNPGTYGVLSCDAGSMCIFMRNKATGVITSKNLALWAAADGPGYSWVDSE